MLQKQKYARCLERGVGSVIKQTLLETCDHLSSNCTGILEVSMSITQRDLVRITSAILECCGAPEHKLIAQLAVIS
jgi:hypothetical protein